MGRKRALLIGAGHAHLHAIACAENFRRRGHELIVVAPGPFWYSGLATGMLGGRYPPELDCIDVAALAARGGARFVEDCAVGLDLRAGVVVLERNAPLAFDALSFNLGNFPPKIPGDHQPGVYSVKPIHRLRALRADLEARFAAGGAPPRVVIAGAGATGAELAGNIARLAQSAGAAAEISVLAARSRLLAQLPPRAAAAVRRNMERRGVKFRLESRVTHLEQGRAVLEGGEGVGFDFFVNATGLQPAPVLQKFGLPLSDEGALVVNACLRSPADARIHGGGDCVALEGQPLPRIGVYAVRQGPVLLHNLLASLEGSQPRRFEPQKKYLWIMNLGDGSGLAARGSLWWRGRSSFLLKDWIDRRFLDAHRPDRAWRG